MLIQRECEATKPLLYQIPYPKRLRPISSHATEPHVTRLKSITLEHAVHQIAEGTPVIPAACQAVLVNEKDVLLETGVEMGLESKLTDHGVMVAVDVSVNAVHAFEDLTNEGRE